MTTRLGRNGSLDSNYDNPNCMILSKIYPCKTNSFCAELEISQAKMNSDNWSRASYWKKVVRAIDPFCMPLTMLPYYESNYGICVHCDRHVPLCYIPPTWRNNFKYWKCTRCEVTDALCGSQQSKWILEDPKNDLADMEDVLSVLPLLMKAWSKKVQSKPFKIKDYCKRVQSGLSTVEEDPNEQNESVLIRTE